MLQLRMPEPGERGRGAQVGEANRVPNSEAGLVRSALPARGAKGWGSDSAPPATEAHAARFPVPGLTACLPRTSGLPAGWSSAR